MIEVFNINTDLFYGILSLDKFAKTNDLVKKRDVEKQGCHYLINYLLGTTVTIKYSETGKPFLNSASEHISISHSHDKLAVIVNKKKSTGIDIELIRDKVVAIQHKFLTKEEQADANNNVEKLIVYWSAKESLYKVLGLAPIDFCAQIAIAPFNYTQPSSTLQGKIIVADMVHHYTLQYEKKGDYILTYII